MRQLIEQQRALCPYPEPLHFAPQRCLVDAQFTGCISTVIVVFLESIENHLCLGFFKA